MAFLSCSPALRLPSSVKLFQHPSPLLHGSLSFQPPRPPAPLVVQAVQRMVGRVVCDTNDKTVNVEVVRIVKHPRYKKRIRTKKKFQAHDPDNTFKVGDKVVLVGSRPISKTKHFIATPYIDPHTPKAPPSDLGLPLQSELEPQPEPEVTTSS